MGRMTSHIWYGKQNSCSKPPTRFCFANSKRPLIIEKKRHIKARWSRPWRRNPPWPSGSASVPWLPWSQRYQHSLLNHGFWVVFNIRGKGLHTKFMGVRVYGNWIVVNCGLKQVCMGYTQIHAHIDEKHDVQQHWVLDVPPFWKQVLFI